MKATHSFRRYLFLLIASFIVVLVTVQLWFFSYIQGQIKTEIQERSLALSNVAVKVASESFFVTRHHNEQAIVEEPKQIRLITKTLATTTPDAAQIDHSHIISPQTDSIQKNTPQIRKERVIRIKIQDTPHQPVDLGDGYTFVTGGETKTVHIDYGDDGYGEDDYDEELEENINSFTKQTPQSLTERESALAFSTIGDAFQLAVAEPDNNVISRHIVQFDENSVIDQYFTWLIMITLLMMVIGIAYALWLAGRISQPLESLSIGFSALEQGEYGKQVPVQGIDDMKRTMERFNHMSLNLQKLKQMEQKLSQQKQLLELNEVTRGLAHTLRNPLNTIGLAIEQIAENEISEQQLALLATQVKDKISRLDGTIKTMLSLNVQGVDRTEVINFTEVIEDIILEFGFSFTGKICFEPVQDITMEGARTEFRAILHTLIANAVEASESLQRDSQNEETQKDILIFAAQDANKVEIKVLDQGTGLLPHIKAELFKPHISSKPEGAGMGLFIANRICESYYKGHISLTDNSPKGCIATVVFNV